MQIKFTIPATSEFEVEKTYFGVIVKEWEDGWVDVLVKLGNENKVFNVNKRWIENATR